MGGVHLDDGTALHSSWDLALSHSILHFRQLVASSSSTAWKPLPVTYPASNASTGYQTPPLASPALERIRGKTVLHKRSLKTGEVYRAVFETDSSVEAYDDITNIDTFQGAIVEPGSRCRWDRLVEGCSTLDVLDTNTRVVHTRYRLGWPSSPRDSITIQRHYCDEDSLICVATSLPRSKHEPAYLKPCPPFVRAHVGIMAWHVQLLPREQGRRLRMTCFFNWTPNGQWAIGASVQSHLPSLLRSLREYVVTESVPVPEIVWMSKGVSVDDVEFDATRVLLTLDFSVVHIEEEDPDADHQTNATIVLRISARSSWDIDLIRRSGDAVEGSEISHMLGRLANCPPHEQDFIYFQLNLTHPPPQLYIKRYRLTLERTMGNPDDVRFNGSLCEISDDSEIPTSRLNPTSLLGDSTSILSDMSLRTTRTYDAFTGAGLGRAGSIMSLETASIERPANVQAKVDETQGSPKANRDRPRSVSINTLSGKAGIRSQSQDKTVASLIKRNYIHFTALLQEPEAKWRRVSESKGVTLFSLNSLDKALAIHRVEAVFVGVSLWDLFAILMNWGARSAWDKNYGDAVLLEYVNEMTELWRVSQKTRPSRDLLRTTYKSNEAMHIFSFTPDASLFPSAPFSADSSLAKEEMSLQGWSLERLSPTTIHVTLIEQVDARNPAAKAITQQMHSSMAGLGETAIKTGGPPVITRLNGAKIAASRYDVDSATLKFTYDAAAVRTITTVPKTVPLVALQTADLAQGEARRGSDTPTVVEEEPSSAMECQIRCDPDRWSPCIEVVVDPPPSSFSVLKRHPLMENGGLWLTIEHNDVDTVISRKVTISIHARPAPDNLKEKPAVWLNGTIAQIDKIDLFPTEIAVMKKQKRSQVTRRSLDQPTSVPLLRRRTTAVPDLKIPEGEASAPEAETPEELIKPMPETPTWAGSISGWLTTAAGGAKSIVVTPAKPLLTAEVHQPFDAAGLALERLVRIHLDRFSESTTADDQWLVASRNGNAIVEKKFLPFISDSIPVFRSSRIIQGSSAEDVSAIISSPHHRKLWDAAKLSDIKQLASYGEGVTVQHLSNKMAFPYKNRAFQTVNIVARAETGGPPSPVPNHTSPGDAALIFHAATSNFDLASLKISPQEYNPQNMPLGTIVLEGWILETLDPYSHDQFPIPSTRCMHVCAVDFGIPLAMNNAANSALPYRILAVEKLLNAESRLAMVVHPAIGISLPRTLLKARKFAKAPKYALVGRPNISVLRLHHTSDGLMEVLVRYDSATLAPKRATFPAEWYKEEHLEPDNQIARPTHARSPSTWSRLTRSRAVTEKLVRSLSETSDSQTAESVDANLLETIVELPSGAGGTFTVSVEPALGRSAGQSPVVESGAQPAWSIEVEKTALPVLRGALVDSQAFLIRIRLQIGQLLQDPLGKGLPSHTEVTGLGSGKTLHYSVKIQKLPPNGSGEVVFNHNGTALPIREPSIISPGGNSGKLDARVRDWSKLKRVDPNQKDLALADHLRTDLEPLLVLPAPQPFIKASVKEASSIPGVNVAAERQSQLGNSPAEFATRVEKVAGVDNDLPSLRPPSQRMNSIYTYLKKPARFPWPTSTLSPNSSDVKAQETEATANAVEEPVLETTSTSPSAISQTDTDSQMLTAKTIFYICMTAVLFFLLGSLVRSLLGEHQDFFTILPHNSSIIEPEWQEMTRVIEVKIYKWHIVLALLRDRAA